MGLSLQMTHEMNRQLAEDHGLSLADYSVLVALTDSPDGRRQLSDLASEIGWERSRLSHHFKRMCARGLAERKASSTDGRATDVVLTEAGRDAVQRAAPGHVALVKTLFFDGLTDADVDRLGDLLTRLRAQVRERGTL
ncbi:MarR family winged helix-turn-helix transcriptional regulator [Actinomycetes bacterium M1A6_2h]